MQNQVVAAESRNPHLANRPSNYVTACVMISNCKSLRVDSMLVLVQPTLINSLLMKARYGHITITKIVNTNLHQTFIQPQVLPPLQQENVLLPVRAQQL